VIPLYEMTETIESAKAKHALQGGSVEVHVPASTSNLGAGFDCFGLALQLYLTVRATADPASEVECRVRVREGNENAGLSLNAENLIYRSMVFAAERQGVALPPVCLNIDNEIPVGRGLGSSAAATVAGLKLFEGLCGQTLADEVVLQYANEIEGHPDNAAAALLGGLVVSCVSENGTALAVKRPWPSGIKIIVVVPELHLATNFSRAVLPSLVSHAEAIFNLQRAALFDAALAEGAYDLLWEAMQDRLHQQARAALVPGLAEALATTRMPGLLGVALSGAGPSVAALAQENFAAIGETIAQKFAALGVATRVLQLEADTSGCKAMVL
jgi:homoserine kinase